MSSGSTEAGWYPDPRGRAELRYWDGTGWTDHVATHGHRWTDPLVAVDEPFVPSWPRPAAANRQRPPRQWFDWVFDVAAVAGLAIVLLFPFVAVAAAPTTPKLDDAAVALPPLQRDPAGTGLRTVPVFDSGGAAEKAVQDGAILTDRQVMGRALDAASTTVFGARGDGGLSTLVQNANDEVAASSTTEVDEAHIPYPFTYPEVDRILDARLGTGPLPSDRVGPVDDLAGLLVIAGAKFPEVFPNAPPVAFDLYDRARQGDDCDAQLNLAFLLSTDENPRDDDTAAEYGRAAKDCPNDPTPLWLLGEFQSERATGAAVAGQQLDQPELQKRALATFAELEHTFPGSSTGWSGEADTLVRLGYVLDVGEPFTARADFRRAKALYQRAEQLDDDPGLAAGEARADAGLAQFDAAVTAQQRAVDKVGDAAPFQVRLVDYLERAHRFGDAADTNAGFLSGSPTFPPGDQLFPQTSGFDEEAFAEDAFGPVSIGSERMLPVQLAVGPPPGGAGGGATDISFIPQFRAAFGVTGSDRWCREWSRRRDLVLAGRADEALDGFPSSFLDARPNQSDSTCEDDNGLLKAVATFESGDTQGAVDGFTSQSQTQSLPDSTKNDHDPALVAILDADQNMWRFAGDLTRAAKAASQWSDSEPDDPLGPDRAGEIAFLDKRFDDAAGDFADAATRATGEQVATEQLKQGTALELAGHHRQAQDLLQQADTTASASVPADLGQADASGDTTALQAVLDSYNARLQAGDTALRDHDYATAETHYHDARERETLIPQDEITSGTLTSRRERLLRPEVLENNEALVLVELGRPADGLTAAQAAVAFDPADPIFLENQGFAQEKLGDLDAAAASYRAVLASDPTVFPAANDLGVILAQQGDLDGAVHSFEQALASDPSYATAEFNLGLALDRQGPVHALASQGELAAAGRDDASLREQDHTFIFDDDSFFTTLDLSKPVPPDWHFASNTRRTPITVGAIVLGLLLYRLLKALAVDRASDAATERTLRASGRGRVGRVAHLGRKVPAALALVAVVAVFVFPLTQSTGTTATDVVLLAVGIGVTTLAFMRLRTAIARRDAVRTRHYSWVPSILFGGAAAVVGVSYAPLPATEDDGTLPRRARWIGTGLLGGLTLTLLVVGRVTSVPLASALGAACLVMTASALTPVEPYDGAYLEEGHAGLYAAIALAVVGVLLFLGIL